MNEPLVLIGIPQQTAELLQLVARKIGVSMAEVMSQALKDKAMKHLDENDIAPKTPAKPLPKQRGYR